MKGKYKLFVTDLSQFYHVEHSLEPKLIALSLVRCRIKEPSTLYIKAIV